MSLEGGLAVELLLAAPALMLDGLAPVVGEDVMPSFLSTGFKTRERERRHSL